MQPKVAHYYVTLEIGVQPAGGPAVRACHAPVTPHWTVDVPRDVGVGTPGIDDELNRLEMGLASDEAPAYSNPKHPSVERDIVSRWAVTLAW